MARKAASNQEPAVDAETRICVIYGEDEMLKRQTLEQLRAALIAKHNDVEPLVFDGQSSPLADVLDELRSYGLMQQHKIVIVDDADVFVSAHREALERYAQNPVDNGVLVFRGSK